MFSLFQGTPVVRRRPRTEVRGAEMGQEGARMEAAGQGARLIAHTLLCGRSRCPKPSLNLRFLCKNEKLEFSTYFDFFKAEVFWW